VLAYTSSISQQSTTVIDNSSTSHVQMGLLEVQFYFMFWLVEPSSGNTYQQQFLKLLIAFSVNTYYICHTSDKDLFDSD
jgi:hypothetical protein